MKTYKYIYSGKLLLMLFAAMFMVNCSDDSPASGDDTQQGDNNNGDGNKEDEKIQTISVDGILAQQSASRAGWEVTPDGNISAIWGASTTDVKTVVSGKDGFKKFEDEKLYSETDVTASSDNKQSAMLNIKSKIADTYAAGDYVYSFNTAENTSVETSETSVKYSLAIPAGLSQSQPDDISHISSYGYVFGKGTVSEDVKSAALQFDILPSVLRLKINNASEQDLKVKSVKVNGKFSNNADITLNKDGQIAYSYTQEENAVGITVNTADMLIANASSAYVYTAIFPTKYQDSESLEFVVEGTRGTEPVTFTKTYSCSSLKPSDASEFEFASNHNYTIAMDITINGMDNVNVTIDDFVPGHGSAVTDSKSCWFVTPEGKSTGTSWASAGTLASVLSKANDGDVVYIAAGDYNIASQITLKYNLSIIGGYAGGEENLNNPDPETNIVNFIGGENTRCFNIANSSTESGSLRILGINFKNFNLTTPNSGGVINISQGGSEVYLENLTFTDCSVLHDNSNKDFGSNGGAIYINSYEGETVFNIIGCEFKNCSAKEGGAMYLNNADISKGKMLNITECRFFNNSSVGSGGAIHLRVGNDVKVVKSVFSGNVASTIDNVGNSGCIHLYYNNNLIVDFCTMFGNIASAKGSVIYGNGNAEATQNHITINNSIIVANNASRTSSGRWALEADNIGVNNIFVIHNSIVANNTNAKNGVADLAILNASESNIITNSIVNNKYLDNGIATDAPSSGTYKDYLNEAQLIELKSKVGIPDSEILNYVKTEQ